MERIITHFPKKGWKRKPGVELVVLPHIQLEDIFLHSQLFLQSYGSDHPSVPSNLRSKERSLNLDFHMHHGQVVTTLQMSVSSVMNFVLPYVPR